jgi:hypothetical protein
VRKLVFSTLLLSAFAVSVAGSLAGQSSATLKTFTVSPSTVEGGTSATGTVTLNSKAGSDGVTVSLASNSSAATAPLTVTVRPWSTKAYFNIDTTMVDTTTLAGITAMIPGSKPNFKAFYDRFNRNYLGDNYVFPESSFFGAPITDGSRFYASTDDKTTVALLVPTAAVLQEDQFARIKVIGLNSTNSVPSLFLRMTLKPDLTDIQSGYELDFGEFPEGGYYFALYYKDPVIKGWRIVQDITPMAVPINPGSVVEFRAFGTSLQMLVDGEVTWNGTNQGLTSGTPGVGGFGPAVLDEFYAGTFVASETNTKPFHDDFDRTEFGNDYTLADSATFFGPPVVDGSYFLSSNFEKTTVALVQPSAAAIGGNQFARATLVDFMSPEAVPSLFLRTTLTPDKTDIQSGYELDLGKMPDWDSEYFAIYYKENLKTGWKTVQDITVVPVRIWDGSEVEFRAYGDMLQLVVNGEIAWSGINAGRTDGAPGIGGWGNALMDEFWAGNFVADTRTATLTVQPAP